MYGWIVDTLISLGVHKNTQAVALALTFAAAAVLCLAVCPLVRLLLVCMARKVLSVRPVGWLAAALENRLPQRLADNSIPIVIQAVAYDMPPGLPLLGKAAEIAAVVVFVLVLNALLNTAHALYTQTEVSKLRPIKGILQVVQVVVYIVAGIVAVAILMDSSPLVLLGGLGALAAVISFVFQDPILGFVAGIQLTANQMIRIGDWIEMPKYAADGDVIEISMTTVKVRNFDNTITSIPAQALVNDAFVNWRGMAESGGRRIKRAVTIDAASVRLCSEADERRFAGMALIADYMAGKLAEMEHTNKEHGADENEPVNVRHLTNLGTFRAYMLAYLRRHPGIHSEMTVMVRQLAAQGAGIPLEVYAFTSTTAWAEYEGIQSDIFDHFYSVAPEFGLAVYQQPSGSDIRSLSGGN